MSVQGDFTRVAAATTREFGFSRFLTFLRWAVVLGGFFWSVVPPFNWTEPTAGAVLIAYAAYRTVRPIDYRAPGITPMVAIVTEVIIGLAAVMATNDWYSPYLFTLIPPVAAAGFTRSRLSAIQIALFALVAMVIGALLFGQDVDQETIVTWSGELLLIAVVSSYGRGLLERVEAADAMGQTQARQLAHANALLSGLDRLSRDLSGSFDFQDTARDAIVRVRHAIQADSYALLLDVPDTDQWDVAMAEGLRLPSYVEFDALPLAVRRVITSEDRTVMATLSPDIPGLDERSHVGLYGALRVQGRLVGVLAVESARVDPFSEDDARALAALADAVALTVDNARWFERLQARGATRERTRIARDLHDRLGQSVAYVAFELDRLHERSLGGELEAELNALKMDARSIVTELRETLSDLRTDVSDDHGLVPTVEHFLQRVETRSGIETHLEAVEAERLAVGQEREVWRIAQESITNAERHAEATSITVRWRVQDHTAVLEIEDDGVGFSGSVPIEAANSLGRPSYGVTGMRERAALLGASLEIKKIGDKGTLVRLQVSATAYAASNIPALPLSTPAPHHTGDQPNGGR